MPRCLSAARCSKAARTIVTCSAGVAYSSALPATNWSDRRMLYQARWAAASAMSAASAGWGEDGGAPNSRPKMRNVTRSAADEGDELDEADFGVGTDGNLVIEAVELAVVHEDEESSTPEGLDGLGALLRGVEHPLLPQAIAVENALGIRRLHQPLEVLRLRAVVLLHLLRDPPLDQLSHGDPLGSQVQLERADAATAGPLVVDSERRSHWLLLAP